MDGVIVTIVIFTATNIVAFAFGYGRLSQKVDDLRRSLDGHMKDEDEWRQHMLNEIKEIRGYGRGAR